MLPSLYSTMYDNPNVPDKSATLKTSSESPAVTSMLPRCGSSTAELPAEILVVVLLVQAASQTSDSQS